MSFFEHKTAFTPSPLSVGMWGGRRRTGGRGGERKRLYWISGACYRTDNGGGKCRARTEMDGG